MITRAHLGSRGSLEAYEWQGTRPGTRPGRKAESKPGHAFRMVAWPLGPSLALADITDSGPQGGPRTQALHCPVFWVSVRLRLRFLDLNLSFKLFLPCQPP